MVPVAAAVTADETEALKAEITKAVKQVQEAGEEEMGGGGARVSQFLPRHLPSPQGHHPVVPTSPNLFPCRPQHPDPLRL